jgi:hypothetical protein
MTLLICIFFLFKNKVLLCINTLFYFKNCKRLFLTFACSLVIVKSLLVLISKFYENVCQSFFFEPVFYKIFVL